MPCWQALCEAYGFEYVSVNELSELALAIAKFQRTRRPTLTMFF